MDSSAKDRVEGLIDEKKGDTKESLGKLRDDEQQEHEGKADQAEGGLQQGLADVKDKVSDTVKKATN